MEWILKCQKCNCKISSTKYNEIITNKLEEYLNVNEEIKNFEDNAKLYKGKRKISISTTSELPPKYVLDNDIHGIIYFECIYCGDYMYNDIDLIKKSDNFELDLSTIMNIKNSITYLKIPESFKIAKADKELQDKFFTIVDRLIKYNILKYSDDIWYKNMGYCFDANLLFDASNKILKKLKDKNILNEYLENNKKNKLNTLLDNNLNLEIFDVKELDIFLEELKTIIKHSNLIIK